MVGGRSARGSRRHAAAASVVVPFPRGAAGARLDLVRFVPSGRSLLVDVRSPDRDRPRLLGRLRDPRLRHRHDRDRRRAACSPAGRRASDQQPRGSQPRLDRRRRGRGRTPHHSRSRRRLRRSCVPEHARDQDRARAAGRRHPSRARRHGSRRGAGKVIREIAVGTEKGVPRLWIHRGTTIRVGGLIPAVSCLRPARWPRRTTRVSRAA